MVSLDLKSGCGEFNLKQRKQPSPPDGNFGNLRSFLPWTRYFEGVKTQKIKQWLIGLIQRQYTASKFSWTLYYRRFVNFSTIARPLHKCGSKSNFNWTEDCQKSLNSLKQALTASCSDLTPD
ncbi:hypothetical protein NPIL_9541 [Nephila pilipes]|uniref:Uncharacterized protein n=1 Tax=Nephila pilipes TaxID=299642 RepID=A0A8X6P5G3_NEPPI|nr:hypothetical protein NPIL_9541 [Nephila pilipes]